MEQTTTGMGQQPQGSVDPSLDQTTTRFIEAFNRFDSKEVASFFADDGTLLNPFGNYGRGRSEVERIFNEDAKTFLAGSTSKFTIVGLRRLADDCAFLDLEHDLRHCRMPDGSTIDTKQHVVVLARKTGDGWRFLDVRPYAMMARPNLH